MDIKIWLQKFFANKKKCHFMLKTAQYYARKRHGHYATQNTGCRGISSRYGRPVTLPFTLYKSVLWWRLKFPLIITEPPPNATFFGQRRQCSVLLDASSPVVDCNWGSDRCVTHRLGRSWTTPYVYFTWRVQKERRAAPDGLDWAGLDLWSWFRMICLLTLVLRAYQPASTAFE